MLQLPEALGALATYPQFILWTAIERGGKIIKLPINPHTLRAFDKGDDWQQKPERWTDYATAAHLAGTAGPNYNIGFLFTALDPFYFVDIDGCLNPDGATWSDLANDIMARLPGAAVEVSQSNTGLHIIGKYTGPAPEHACKNTALNIELYTTDRFIALTGTNVIGSAAIDNTAQLQDLINIYYQPGQGVSFTDWTMEPVPEWNGLEDDTELVAKALTSRSTGAAFGAKSSFQALWEGDEDALAEFYPHDLEPFDRSSADMALAQHLVFWTGKNCERTLVLMGYSRLKRDKWERADYLKRTILKACGLQGDVYGQNMGDGTTALADQYGGVQLKAGSEKQRDYASGVRENKLACTQDEEVRAKLCATWGPVVEASFWLDNQNMEPEALAIMAAPVEHALAPYEQAETAATGQEPAIMHGYQFLGISQQIEFFRGCVYVQDLHRVLVPDGSLLKPDQFNVVYGGYAFQKDAEGKRSTTSKAWAAFTESQAVRYPKAQGLTFLPDKPPGDIIKKEGRTLVNCYVPYEAPRLQGDPTPFLDHLALVLPVEGDRAILMAYMAACVQHKGYKFQWAPLLQGCEGNGKTLFTRCVANAIGKRYTFYPKAAAIDSDFNGWLLNKLFIGVEDVYVPAHRQEMLETLKPMITGGDGIEIQFKGADQVTADICANFMLNSNHKDAIRKTKNDRRFAVFYTAQQSYEDLQRDGMLGEYFPELYAWLNADGYKIVTELLHVWPIPAELNPSGSCQRAPETSTTAEAINISLGGIEQEIMEAIQEGRPGFAGGWVSSMAMDKLLEHLRATRTLPINRRRDLLKTLGYDWHPALRDGRVNNVVPVDAGKPRLFIKKDHIHANLQTAKQVEKAYQEAQSGAATGPGGTQAERLFGPEK